jgi:hypothetical protein
MKNKILPIFTIILMSLLMAGAVSASGPYYGNIAAVNGDTVKASGVTYALLVGVSTYKDPANNLDGVQYDVPHMRDMLISDCGYSSSRITTLEDSKATKSAIRSALIQMSSRAGKDDTVVFYFSGHGYVYPSYYGTSYLEPYDSAQDSVTYDISSSELKQWLDGLPCANVLVVIDACEAEGMLKAGTKELVTTSQVTSGSDAGSASDRFSQNFLGQFETGNLVSQSSAEQQKGLAGTRYVVLVSCRSGEGSWTNAVSGSWFTTYLVEGIGSPSADTNADNWISAEEAFAYASPLTTWKHYDQNPVLYDGNPSADLLMNHYNSLPVGKISVSSSPSGARIYLDGTDMGFNTPATLTSISAGSHTIILKKSGYNDYSTSVTVTGGQTSGISATLTVQQTTGSINVRSTPTGATIVIDGTTRGTTPATLTSISAGSHTIVLKKSGYNDYSTNVTVTGGQMSSISVTMTVQQTTGSINVRSTPGGATIVLDGKTRGTTPATLTGISAGSHTIVLKKSGYNDYPASVTVTAGQTSSISATLTVQQITGSINIKSTPAGATIVLDGMTRGTTPATLTGISSGSHTIVLKKSGYNDYSTGVTVTGGQTSGISATMTGQQTAGSISVSSSPSGAAVSIDGISTGYKSPATLTGISPGSHTVSCSLTGYTDQSRSVTVTAGQTVAVVLNLPAIGTSTGSIYVTSQPSKALVYLDGKYLGVYSPTTISKVTAGTHTLRLTKYGYKDYTQSVTVSAGATTPVSAVMARGW